MKFKVGGFYKYRLLLILSQNTEYASLYYLFYLNIW